MRNSVSTFLAGLLLLTCSGTAMAGARPPAKPVSLAFYSGKWFEISRTPNAGQRDCEAATTQFTSTGDDAFKVVQVCRKGSASGPAKIFNTRGTILTGTGNAKFSMTFLGGLKKQEYWVLDRADDQSWAIMATPGGNYVWLLARQAVMTPAAKAVALARVRSLGYAKLEFPAHPAK